MKISRTESLPDEAPPDAFASGADTPFPEVDGGVRAVFAGEAGGSARRLLIVPGTDVSIHWLDLPADLAPAQAAAAARLMMADLVAQPLHEMHVAAGRREEGLTCIAAAPVERMAEWLARAAEQGFDPDMIVPEPLLLPVPEQGLARRDRGGIADYRGRAIAFTLEPELARHVAGDAPVIDVDDAAFEAGLDRMLADPPVNLRQGPFAIRQGLRVAGQIRRIGLIALVLVALTLAVQVASVMRLAFSADRMEAEAAEIARAAGGEARLAALRGAGAGYSATMTAVFGAVEAVPNVEMVRMTYMPDGALVVAVQADSPATIDLFRQRIEAEGFQVETGAAASGGGRPEVELTVRPI